MSLENTEKNKISLVLLKDMSKSRFNPPPPPVYIDCMRDLEIFINLEDMDGLPSLIFIALIHYQFEASVPRWQWARRTNTYSTHRKITKFNGSATSIRESIF